MFAKVDVVTVFFGSLGGIAALVMAINTWLLRREAKKQKAVEKAGSERMDTMEASQESFTRSQASLQTALARADIENERLRGRVSSQDTEIAKLREEVSALRSQVEALTRAK